MNRRDALKGIATSAAAVTVPVAAASASTRQPNRYGWPDCVTVGETPLAINMRPYLDGKRVYGGVDACDSEGWIRALKMTPDNHTPDCDPARGHNGSRQYVLLRGRVAFRTVNPDGSWPD